MIQLSEDNIAKYNKLYNSRYQKFGYNPKTLGWYTGKQNMRFEIATKDIDFRNKTICDIGCGFSDLYIFLCERIKDVEYTGIDLNLTLLHEAENNIKRHGLRKPNLFHNDFLDKDFKGEYDIVIALGCCSLLLSGQDNYQYIKSIISKGFSMARFVFIIDSCSEYFDNNNSTYGYSYDPIKVIQIAYSFTPRLVLINDYFPTEFMVKMYKNTNHTSSYIYNDYR
ncbi:MAG: class I SAM-dependent methyltransferase [Bacteroidales bacterium]|nr:class I SAM-dependent methyltransferase [Bacteroidales bacterium]